MNYRFNIKNLDCANCAKKIEEGIAKNDIYEDVIVNFSTSKLSFKSNEQDKEKVLKEINFIADKIEPGVQILDTKEKQEQTERNSKDIIRLAVGVILFGIAMYVNIDFNIKIVLMLVSLLILLSKTAMKAYKQVFKNKTLDENSLITISCIGAFLVGKQMEAAMVIVLYEIGKILEAKAISKTRRSITSLMDIRPEYANIKKGNKIEKVDPEVVKTGEIIVIKPGEKIPLDGVIIKGKSEIDNSALTGESALVSVEENSKVLSGSINIEGVIEVEVEKTYENSTVSQILNLVENATDKKAKTETFVSKAAKIYTPVVLGLAILVAVFMPMIFSGVTYSESIYKALIFLVISCPCSIAISVPLSYFSGIGKCSKRGILVKGSNYLDSLKNINEIVFDKTGTITTGKFEVSKVNSFNNDYNEKEILRLFALGEKFSNHPISKSILEKVDQDKSIKYDEFVEGFEEISGKGIKYKLDGKQVLIGNAKLVDLSQELENKYLKDEKISTVLYLKLDNEVIGNILINDVIKKDAKQTVNKLNKLGILTKMFTGDKKEVAKQIAKQVGIKEVKYEMLPTDKYAELEKQIGTGRNVAFVGDGINDSPVLARSDIGISMGGIGSSAAIEASDVVIMTDELDKIPEAISISKRTNTIIKQNLIFAIGVKILILILAVLGITDMWEAVFADVGTTLITILNTLRILK